MSGAWLSSYVQPGLRFARRNSGKIALFTIAAGSAIGVAAYMRRQFAEVNETLREERAVGARKLRAAFITNTQTVLNTFRALLPIAQELLRDVARIDSSTSVAALRAKPTDRAQKQRLWEQVKLASITHLTSALYIVALLYSFLSLQVNLLARYQSAALDAPVQALPNGSLSAATSKQFLEVVRRTIFDSERIEAIVDQVESAVLEHTACISLTSRMGIQDVEDLFANILSSQLSRSSADHSEDDDTRDGCRKSLSLASPQRWLLANKASLSGTGSGEVLDANYEWLMQESLDLCEVLDFTAVLESNTQALLSYAMNGLNDGGPFADESVKLPLAHLLARFDSQATSIFALRATSINEGEEEGLYPGRSGIEVALSESQDGCRFAASVFLSGEKEKSTNRQNDTSARLQMRNERAQNRLVTDVSVAQDVVNNTDPDLGLMFDVA